MIRGLGSSRKSLIVWLKGNIGGQKGTIVGPFQSIKGDFDSI